MTMPSISDSYDMIDRFLRNNMDDDDYAVFSGALDAYGAACAAAARAESAAEIERLRTHAVVLAETARQVEQEACAKLVESQNTNGDPVQCWLDIIAVKIRARVEA